MGVERNEMGFERGEMGFERGEMGFERCGKWELRGVVKRVLRGLKWVLKGGGEVGVEGGWWSGC